MFDRETLKFINTFAPWLSALGTFAAVTVSLYLARRSDRISLKLSLGIRMLAIQGGGPGHGTRFVFLSVTNMGRRSASLTSPFFKPLPWSKVCYFWMNPQNSLSVKRQTTLHL